MLLRPSELVANAEDINGLKAFVTSQVPKYGSIGTPTIVMTGDVDTTISPHIHSEAIAAVLPHGKLVVLPGIGHMPHHAAADTIIAEIDKISGRESSRPADY
jgi:pimeloyl-ACP methyl ester carboxylesterase